MSLLRSNEVVALDQVTEACQKVADHSEGFAQAAESTRAAELFTELASRYQKFVARLDDQVKQLDDLPTRPDPDREAIEQAIARLQATLGEDRDRILLERTTAHLDAVREKVAEALALELPAAARKLLVGLREASDEHLRRIASIEGD